MFKVQITVDGRMIDMPHDSGLRLSEACYRADIYKKHNSKCTFTVVNEENGDFEYQI